MWTEREEGRKGVKVVTFSHLGVTNAMEAMLKIIKFKNDQLCFLQPPCSPMFFGGPWRKDQDTGFQSLLNLPSILLCLAICLCPCRHFCLHIFPAFLYPYLILISSRIYRSIHLHTGPQNILKFIFYDPCLLDWTDCKDQFSLLNHMPHQSMNSLKFI